MQATVAPNLRLADHSSDCSTDDVDCDAAVLVLNGVGFVALDDDAAGRVCRYAGELAVV